MTDDQSPPDDPQLIVVYEVEGEQEDAAQAGTVNPLADEARKRLGKVLRDIMETALRKHELWREVEASINRMIAGDPAADATKIRANIIADLKKDGVDLTAPHKAIRITTGSGKSDLSRQAIAVHYIPKAKSKKLPHRVLIAVPTHKLADEARVMMPAGITVAIWQGRDAIKLGTTDEKMCLNPEAVKAAIEIGAAVEETACRKARRGEDPILCPFYNKCAYQAQKAAAREADVLFCAHEILFKAPTVISDGSFGLVIVDESFWQDGISGVAAKSRLVIDSLAHELKDAPVRDKAGNRLDLDTEALLAKIELLQSALEQMPDGYVQRQPLLDAGLETATAYEHGSCAQAAKMEWARANIHSGLLPNSTDEARKEAVQKYGFLKRIPKRWAMWKALEDLINSTDDATGRLILETDKSSPDGEQRYIRVLQRKDIIDAFKALPLIHLDATMPFGLVKHFLPDLDLILDLKVKAPHMTITQVVGMPVGKSSLQPLKANKRKPEEEARVCRKRQRLVDAVRHLVRGRRGLVITYQSIEQEFAGIEGVDTAHFGAIEGIDRWGDVDVLVMIGRPLPKTRDIQNMAAAVTGKPVIAGDLTAQECSILKGPLTGRIVKRRIYNNPEADMIRQAVTEAAIEQAIGRVRGINRMAANPVEVFLVLDDIVLEGLPVDEVIDITDIEPDAIDHMLARGWEPQMPTDAAKICPDLFPNREAAKKAYQRDRLRTGQGSRGPRLGTWPTKGILFRPCPQPPCVDLCYQPAGRGQLPRFCMVDLVKVPDPAPCWRLPWAS